MGRNHGIRLVDIDDIAVSTLQEIDEAPTADVQPVIHARWVDEGDCHRCSKCRAVLEEEFNWHYHQYCYHCGARMDGGEKNATD